MTDADVLLRVLNVGGQIREAIDARAKRDASALAAVDAAWRIFAGEYLSQRKLEGSDRLALANQERMAVAKAGRAGLDLLLQRCPQADDAQVGEADVFGEVQTDVYSTDPDMRARLVLQNVVKSYVAGIAGIADSAQFIAATKQYLAALATDDRQCAVDKLTFADVAGNGEAKRELMAITEDLRHADVFRTYGLNALDSSLLLAGPPGCGKTYLVKAFANECGLPFREIRIPDVLSCMYGKSAQNLRRMLDASGVVFLDEIDALGRSRSMDTHEATASLVATMCAELDGVSRRQDRILIAATNLEERVDPALLRPPRLSRIIRMEPPMPDDLVDAFHKHRARYEKQIRIFGEFDDGQLAQELRGRSYADVAEIVKRIAVNQVRREYRGATRTLTLFSDVAQGIRMYERA